MAEYEYNIFELVSKTNSTMVFKGFRNNKNGREASDVCITSQYQNPVVHIYGPRDKWRSSWYEVDHYLVDSDGVIYKGTGLMWYEDSFEVTISEPSDEQKMFVREFIANL